MSIFHGQVNKIEERIQWIQERTNVVFLDTWNEETIQTGDVDIPIRSMKGLTFLARNPQHPLTQDFYPMDFSYTYNGKKDEIDFIASRFYDTDKLLPLLYTYQKPKFFESAKGEKRKLPVVGQMKYGKGRIFLSLLPLEGFVGKNPVIDRFLHSLIYGE